MTEMDIPSALSQLDPGNSAQWTDNGLPREEAVSMILGHSVTRDQITEAAPEFTRANPMLDPVFDDDPAATDAETPAEGDAPTTDDPAASADSGTAPAEPDTPTVGPEDLEAATVAETPAEGNPVAEKAARIRGALQSLDGDEDEHWSPHGIGDADIVSAMLREDVTYDEIEAAAPGYRRHKRTFEGQAVDPVAVAYLDDDGMTPLQREVADQRRAGAARYEEIGEEMTRLQTQIEGLKARISVLQQEQAYLQRFAPNPNEHDHRADQVARMHFIRSQQEARMRRAGFAPDGSPATNGQPAAASKPDVRAPIDRALNQRKTPMGGGRPAFPNPTEAR